jgi:hypothetical protein
MPSMINHASSLMVSRVLRVSERFSLEAQRTAVPKATRGLINEGNCLSLWSDWTPGLFRDFNQGAFRHTEMHLSVALPVHTMRLTLRDENEGVGYYSLSGRPASFIVCHQIGRLALE